MFGTGYVGLVSGVCFAELGNDVICADVDTAKVELLNRGGNPIYEPGLTERKDRGAEEGRLKFTHNLKLAVESSDILFICVGTPQKLDGGVDMRYIESVARTIGEHLDSKKVIINKSTVPVGTADRVRRIIREQLKKRNAEHDFAVVSNPEFLREGAAVNDFFNPDRIVVGSEENDQWARDIMDKLYAGVARAQRPVIHTDTKSAELTKYASNAMLATRISFMNQLSRYCESVGADITAVAKGMGFDSRIGSRFLHAGIGYGGSCFPKDVRGLIASMKEAGADSSIFIAVHEANEAQKRTLFPKIERELGSLEGKRVAVWGLAFKPKTDDIREAPSLAIIEWLLSKGATVAAYDPEATDNFKKEFPSIEYAEKPYDALQDADALVLCTEWDEFRNPDWKRVKELMSSPILFDGRNVYKGYRKEFEFLGIKWFGVGL